MEEETEEHGDILEMISEIISEVMSKMISKTISEIISKMILKIIPGVPRRDHLVNHLGEDLDISSSRLSLNLL